MERFKYKIKSVSGIRRGKILHMKLFTIIRLLPENNNYTIETEDEYFNIKIKTNILNGFNSKNIKYLNMKILEDKSLYIQVSLLSNFNSKHYTFNSEQLCYNFLYKEDNKYLSIKFFPKKPETIGSLRLKALRVKLPGLKKKEKRKLPGNKQQFIQIYHGGGCGGK